VKKKIVLELNWICIKKYNQLYLGIVSPKLNKMNTLRKLWDDGKQIHEDLNLRFENQKLISWEVEPKRIQETYTREVVESLVKDLIQKEMITFWDDVPNMSVSVPIQEIGMDSEEGNEEEPLFIETFHYDEDVDDTLHDRGYDVPMLLHKFMGLSRELNHTDF
jgi:hypothetical protein